jgi:hypothetical protein
VLLLPGALFAGAAFLRATETFFATAFLRLVAALGGLDPVFTAILPSALPII